mgnify:CR=1 FL=1
MTEQHNKINLLDLTRAQMQQFFVDMGEKPFRADQVMKWIYHFCIDDFDKMSNINKVLREKLKARCVIDAPGRPADTSFHHVYAFCIQRTRIFPYFAFFVS